MKKILIMLMTALFFSSGFARDWTVNKPIFNIWFPDTWQVVRNTDGMALKATAPDEDCICQLSFMSDISDLNEQKGKEIMQRFFNNLKNKFRNFRKAVGFRYFNENSRKICIFGWKAENQGVDLKLGFTIISSRGSTILMTTTISAASAGKYSQIGEKIYNSIRFY